MRVIRNTRLAGADQVRAAYRAALATGRPTLICSNHLTMVDSAYLHWALAPLWVYLVSFRRFAWNVAALEHFAANPFLRGICFLGKVVPIDRGGADEHRRGVLHTLRWLVSHGEVCMLFPEGARSRTGRVDDSNLTYGVGQILKDLERPQVLCAYVRGARQEQLGVLPAFGDTVSVEVELFEPRTDQVGLRAARDLSRQVVAKLKLMEDAHLARRGIQSMVNP